MRLNILRMRPVIMKPLTMLVVASATAIITRARMKSFFGPERTTSAAMIDTEEIAFVSAINGVCRAGVTPHTT